MNKVMLDFASLTKEDINEYSVVIFDEVINLLILELKQNNKNEYLVLGQSINKDYTGEIIPFLHKIAEESRNNLPRKVKKNNYRYDQFLNNEISNHLLLTEEGFDYLMGKYEYTNFLIEKTVELESMNKDDRVVYQVKSSDKFDSTNFKSKFYNVKSLEQNYNLNERLIKSITKKELVNYIRDNRKKLAKMFATCDKNYEENTFLNPVPSEYKKIYQNLSNKATGIEDLALDYYLNSYKDVFYKPSKLVKLNDSALKKYVVSNLETLIKLISFTSEEVESLSYLATSGEKANLIINKIVISHTFDWFNAQQIINFSSAELNEFVDNNWHKIVTLMNYDSPKYSQLYNHAIGNRSSLKKLLIFYVDSVASKKHTEFQNQLNKIDRGEQDDREIRKTI